MDQITMALFERIGLLLLLAFVFTRIPSFKHLLEREISWKTFFYYSLTFGFFSIAGTLAGMTLHNEVLIRDVWLHIPDETSRLAHSGIVGMVMAGLLGGPVVGLGAGCIAGFYLFFFGGITAQAYALSAPFIGIFAGLAARFFSHERIISPAKSLFIGMFATILTMCFVLIFTHYPPDAILFVNLVGIPMVITNSIAIATFTTMIRVVLNEKEQAQAMETKRALNIAERVLPYLKQGLNFETARSTAQLLMNELQPSAVAVTDTKQILSHIGLGLDHHVIGTYLMTKSSILALSSGQVQVIKDKEQIQCSHKNCTLGAAILVPFSQSGQVAGLIKLYFKRPQQIRSVDIVLAQGIGKLISNQLSLVEAEKMSELMKEARLRTLQAQINPHFLFNTLNSIVSLIRSNPNTARHVTLQLAQFMRANLTSLSNPLIPLEEELKHLSSFLEIVEVRFSEQLRVELQIDDHTKDAFIPPSTLQPFVENSIQHGLRDKSSGGLILIQIKQLEKKIYISIEDNGIGIKSYLLDHLGRIPLDHHKGNGIGLYNVNQRLITLLGKKSALHMMNKEEGGSHISFMIPNVENDREVENNEN